MPCVRLPGAAVFITHHNVKERLKKQKENVIEPHDEMYFSATKALLSCRVNGKTSLIKCLNVIKC